MTVMESPVLTVTTAPEAYDGFGTKTVQVLGEKTHRVEGVIHTDRVVRLVATPVRHVQWQRARYASGLYTACEVERWRQIADIVAPWADPLPEEVKA